jgi:hypothetical protein
MKTGTLTCAPISYQTYVFSTHRTFCKNVLPNLHAFYTKDIWDAKRTDLGRKPHEISHLNMCNGALQEEINSTCSQFNMWNNILPKKKKSNQPKRYLQGQLKRTRTRLDMCLVLNGPV